MSYAQLTGWVYDDFVLRDDTTNVNAAIVDATGEKMAFIGQVWNADRATKNITKVGFRFASVTKAGGSGLTLSLQDVDLTTGPAPRPDGTQDQTYAIANGNASFASNTWLQSGALSATRTVAFGEWVAIVIEFDGGGRLGADVAQINFLNPQRANHGSLVSQFTSSWSSLTGTPLCVLEFDDGTFGRLDGGAPITAFGNTTAYAANNTPDEYALEFTVGANCKIDGCWLEMLTSTTSADFDVVLYDGTSAMVTKSFDANAHQVTTAGVRPMLVTFAEQTLAPGNTYRLALKPTGTFTDTVALRYFDVQSASYLAAMGGPDLTAALVSRTDAGAWSAKTTTRRPLIALRLSAIDVGGAAAVGISRARGASGF